jgi:hypothetical protein
VADEADSKRPADEEHSGEAEKMPLGAASLPLSAAAVRQGRAGMPRRTAPFTGGHCCAPVQPARQPLDLPPCPLPPPLQASQCGGSGELCHYSGDMSAGLLSPNATVASSTDGAPS